MSKLFGQMHHAAQFRQVEISLPVFVPNFLNNQYLSEVSMCALFFEFNVTNTIICKVSYFRLNVCIDVVNVQGEQ